MNSADDHVFLRFAIQRRQGSGAAARGASDAALILVPTTNAGAHSSSMFDVRVDVERRNGASSVSACGPDRAA